MGLSAVVENLRTLKKTVKKPIVAFRETVHNAYTKAYVGSPERVDEFYNYIKVYTPSKHNDLCMMSITADINRFSMIPDKNTFFHVLKLERHFDRMIAARKQADVNGDMAIQILSGHNKTFMSKYRRYKTRSAAKELKRSNQRFKALNVRRHTQLPNSGNDDSCIYHDRSGSDDKEEDQTLEQLSKMFNNVVVEPNGSSEDVDEPEIVQEDRKEVSVLCELTKPETVLAAHPPETQESGPIVKSVKIQEASTVPHSRPKTMQKKVHLKMAPEKSMMSVVKKPDVKFKVAKSVSVRKEKLDKAENLKGAEATLLEDVMSHLKLEEQKSQKNSSKPKIVLSDDDDEFDNCDEDSDDGSDIEELEKIEDKDVDALEYEMI